MAAHLQELVGIMLETLAERKGENSQEVVSSLVSLGKERTDMVLGLCADCLELNPKFTAPIRLFVLEAVLKVSQQELSKVSRPVALRLISLASREMISYKENEVSTLQPLPASILVIYSTKFGNEVMMEILERLVPGNIPHVYTLITLSNIAEHNAFVLVPFLKDIFGRLLPLLSVIKADHMKWVFAHSLGASVAAIKEYIANLDAAPYRDFKKEHFTVEISLTHEVFLNNWTQSKDLKVRVAVATAIGHMVAFLEHTRLEDQLLRIFQMITALYSRRIENLSITQSLYMVLEAALASQSSCLSQHLDNLLIGLLRQVSLDDPADLSLMKNHNELLRCFGLLASAFTSHVVTFLLGKLPTGQQAITIAVLSVLRHLISFCDAVLTIHKEQLLTGLQVCFHDNTLKVKKSVVHVIIAMCNNGYLPVQGGQCLIDYLVSQLAVNTDEKPEDGFLLRHLKQMCENILNIASTSMISAERVLWNSFLKYILAREYASAFPVICRCVLTLLSRDDEAKTQEAFSVSKDPVTFRGLIPNSPALLARLLVMCNSPRSYGGTGVGALRLLLGLAPLVYLESADLWTAILPKLIQYLEDHSDENSWSQKEWDDLVLKFLDKTLDSLTNTDWTESFAREMCNQLSVSTGLPQEKNILLKCLGLVLGRITTKEFVQEKLHLIFSLTDYCNDLEREACAQSFGRISATHFDLCLAKLESVIKIDSGKRGGYLLGLLKERVDPNFERQRSLAILCLGHSISGAPSGMVACSSDYIISRLLGTMYCMVREPLVKESLAAVAELTTSALLEHKLAPDEGIFNSRDELMRNILGFITSEPVEVHVGDTRMYSVGALRNLILLGVPMDCTVTARLLSVIVEYVVEVPFPTHLQSHSSVIFEKVTQLCCELIQTRNSSTVSMIIEAFKPPLNSTQNSSKECAVRTFRALFDRIFDQIKADVQAYEDLGFLGVALARMIPRTTDSCLEICLDSIHVVCTILKLENIVSRKIYGKDEIIDNALALTNKIQSMADCFNLVSDVLGVAVSSRVSDSRLVVFVLHLVEGLSDAHYPSASGTCSVLGVVLKTRGQELNREIGALCQDLCSKLRKCRHPAIVTDALVSWRNLASHHLIPVLTAFLGFPLPLEKVALEFWRLLARERWLAQDTLDHLMEKLSAAPSYVEKEDPRDRTTTVKLATHLPVAICFSLTEMLKATEMESLARDNFSKVFSMLVLHLGGTLGLSASVVQNDRHKVKDAISLHPYSLTVDTLKAFLVRSAGVDSVKQLEDVGCWSMISQEASIVDGLTLLTGFVCELFPQCLTDIITLLNNYYQSPIDHYRIVITTVFAEIIRSLQRGPPTMLDGIVSSLLVRLSDHSLVVRKLAIRGLGNAAYLDSLKVGTNAILAAMIAGMDDQDDPELEIALEAVDGLQKIISFLDEPAVRPLLGNICLRLRPLFHKERDVVRVSAFSLFGNLVAKFCCGLSEDLVVEQLHSVLPILLVYLNDSAPVSKSCKGALRQLGPFVGCNSINSMFQKHLIEDGFLLYADFAISLSRLIAAELADRVVYYCTSLLSLLSCPLAEVRAGAAISLGSILGYLDDSVRTQVPKEQILAAYAQLLKDPTAKVRAHAILAIGSLHAL